MLPQRIKYIVTAQDITQPDGIERYEFPHRYYGEAFQKFGKLLEEYGRQHRWMPIRWVVANRVEYSEECNIHLYVAIDNIHIQLWSEYYQIGPEAES